MVGPLNLALGIALGVPGLNFGLTEADDPPLSPPAEGYPHPGGYIEKEDNHS